MKVRRLLAQLFHSLNILNYFREEREKDRQVIRDVSDDLVTAIRLQSEVATKSLSILEAFISTFATNGEPESRVLRNEDEIAAYAERYGLKAEDLEEFNPFTVTY